MPLGPLTIFGTLMQDNFNKPKSVDEVWEKLVSDARRARRDAEDDEYFFGIFDGYMATLALFAAFLGRMEEYVKLCEEMGDITWLVEDSDGNKNFSD